MLNLIKSDDNAENVIWKVLASSNKDTHTHTWEFLYQVILGLFVAVCSKQRKY